MARIVVKTDDGRRVTMDERGVNLRRINNQETAVEVLERMEAAIREADRRLSAPRTPRTPKRRPFVAA